MTAERLAQIAGELEEMGRSLNLEHAEECLVRLRNEVQSCIQSIPKARARVSEEPADRLRSGE
jgi:hypothetical protein